MEISPQRTVRKLNQIFDLIGMDELQPARRLIEELRGEKQPAHVEAELILAETLIRFLP